MSVDIAALDTDLNTLILSGRALEGLEKHYAEDAVMQENFDPPTVGKPANRMHGRIVHERFYHKA